MEVSPRDWPEDFSSENGHYLHKCGGCGKEYIAHKRRIGRCWVCAHPRASLWKRIKRWFKGGYELGTIHNVGAITYEVFVVQARRWVRSGRCEMEDKQVPDRWYPCHEDHWRMFHPKG